MNELQCGYFIWKGDYTWCMVEILQNNMTPKIPKFYSDNKS